MLIMLVQADASDLSDFFMVIKFPREGVLADLLLFSFRSKIHPEDGILAASFPRRFFF